ncbi:MAG: glycoside hydrolase, partial [Oscillospiraceae bacterium]|nr:glycoside hydrolase [Oscillospiraceae bacterium]
GSIDVSDAVLLARFCTEDSTAAITDQGKQNADVNQDGNIELDDVTAILRKIAKLD